MISGAYFKDPFPLFVHFLQFFHFYASYDPNVFTDVLSWLGGMFLIQNMFLNSFVTILRPFEAKKKAEKDP